MKRRVEKNLQSTKFGGPEKRNSRAKFFRLGRLVCRSSKKLNCLLSTIKGVGKLAKMRML